MNDSRSKLNDAARILQAAERICVFTGAGISAESGIATFRDTGGFWQKYPPDEFATWDGLLNLSAKDPARLADFLLELLEPIAGAEPNAGHLALAALEQYRLVTVITQNVDALHHDAGSKNVKEIHGTLFQIVSEDRQWLGNLSKSEVKKIAAAIRKAREERFQKTTLALAVRPMLGLGPEGFYRPNLVLFGDPMNEPDWAESLAAARNSDVFLTVGTSGLVLPAAMLPHEAKATGAKCIAIDPEEESGEIWLQGAAAEVLPALLERAFPS